ncbi:hypothetical protein [Enterococcus thailandicus]|uniref:hypothetical protein n=1 Tax=Enterococcus thailandicus TaxID=417368 RepID=UPI0022E596A1|nr:hypothetical protein [Enterococcus thailandicus]MDT2753144.1 hypothetical protein [Enterococcus thailandicus]
MEYISIYGETIEGKIVSELENTVVVKDKKGVRYLVHKNSIDPKRKKPNFDLLATQSFGKCPENKVQKIGYYYPWKAF